MPPKKTPAKKAKVAEENVEAEQLNANTGNAVAAATTENNSGSSSSNNSVGLPERPNTSRKVSRGRPPVAVAATTTANLPPPQQGRNTAVATGVAVPPPGTGAVMVAPRPVLVNTSVGPNVRPPTYTSMATQTNVPRAVLELARRGPPPALPQRVGTGAMAAVRSGCSTAADYISMQWGVLGNTISRYADAQIPVELAANGSVRYRPDSLIKSVSDNEDGDFPEDLVAAARRCLITSTMAANQVQEVVRAVQEYLAVYVRSGSYSEVVIRDAARGVFEELLLYLVFLYDKIMLRMHIKSYYKRLPTYMRTSSNSQESALELQANVPQVARNIINVFRNLFTAPLQGRIFTNNIISILQKGKIADTLNQIVRMYPDLAAEYLLAPGNVAGAVASTIPIIRGTELAETEEEYEGSLGPASEKVNAIVARRLGLGAAACIRPEVRITREELISRTGKNGSVTAEAIEQILPKRPVRPEIRSALDRLVGDVKSGAVSAKKNVATKTNMGTMTNNGAPKSNAAVAAVLEETVVVPTPEVAAIVETVNEEIRESQQQIAEVAPEGENAAVVVGTNTTAGTNNSNSKNNGGAAAEGGARRRRRHQTRRRKVYRKRSTHRRR